MKSIRWRPMMAGLILGTVIAPGFGAERVWPAPTAEQVAVLERYRVEHARALATGRADGCVEAFAEDIRLMPEYHPTVFGRADAREYYRALLERFDVTRHERSAIRALNLGDRLIEIGRLGQTWVRKEGGTTRQLEGKYLDIWARDEDGTWALAATTWNHARWLEFADELRFPSVPGVRVAMGAHVPVKGGTSFELAALNRLQERAIIEKDDDVWSQFYADDAVLLPNHGPVCSGREEIDAYLKGHAAHMPVYEKLDVRNDRIEDFGDWVIDYASHVAIWRNGAESGVNTGKNIRVWRREPRGGLKMVCQAGTYD